VLLAPAFLGEPPSALQLGGVVLVLVRLLVATAGRRVPEAEPALAE